MPEAGNIETVTLHGRELRVRWRSPRFGEWLAWCYVPAASMLPNEGVGFEARAGSPEEAKAALLEQVQRHLAGLPGE
jgi:hypothetical protein